LAIGDAYTHALGRPAEFSEEIKMQYARSQVWCLTLVVGLAVASGGGISAQGTDPLVGTWKMNAAKSTFSPGPAPKSQTVMIGGTDLARKITVDVAPATGAAQHWEVSGPSGTDLPVVGNNPNADAYAIKRVNATTLEAQYKKAGKPTLKQTAVVSADGKTLTVTGTGTDVQGRTVNNVVVYDR
jgi:hypothetical protein